MKNDKIKVITKNNEETVNFEVDYLLPFFGLKMELGPIANWGLNLNKKHIPVNTENFETNQKELILIYQGKCIYLL